MTEVKLSKKYTTVDVKRWAEAVIAKEGYGSDFVYRDDTDIRCVYVRDGACSCLVGHMLHDNGILDMKDLEFYNFDGVYSLLDSMGRLSMFTDEAIDFMDFLQAEQDKAGTPWGHALKKAIDRYGSNCR